MRLAGLGLLGQQVVETNEARRDVIHPRRRKRQWKCPNMCSCGEFFGGELGLEYGLDFLTVGDAEWIVDDEWTNIQWNVDGWSPGPGFRLLSCYSFDDKV